jgi:hypothetical protein
VVVAASERLEAEPIARRIARRDQVLMIPNGVDTKSPVLVGSNSSRGKE